MPAVSFQLSAVSPEKERIRPGIAKSDTSIYWKTMRDYRKLKIWERAHKITLKIYQVTRSFPSDERYGLVSQMRRAAVSVPTNIAEGYGRCSDVELGRFLEIAYASGNELS
jgi:hypothetical protein